MDLFSDLTSEDFGSTLVLRIRISSVGKQAWKFFFMTNTSPYLKIQIPHLCIKDSEKFRVGKK